MKKLLFLLVALLALNSCGYKVAKDYREASMGRIVFVSQAGIDYDDLWVNIDKGRTWLAKSAIYSEDGTYTGMAYAISQGNRKILVRKQNGPTLFEGKVAVEGNNVVTPIYLRDR